MCEAHHPVTYSNLKIAMKGREKLHGGRGCQFVNWIAPLLLTGAAMQQSISEPYLGVGVRMRASFSVLACCLGWDR